MGNCKEYITNSGKKFMVHPCYKKKNGDVSIYPQSWMVYINGRGSIEGFATKKQAIKITTQNA